MPLSAMSQRTFISYVVIQRSSWNGSILTNTCSSLASLTFACILLRLDGAHGALYDRESEWRSIISGGKTMAVQISATVDARSRAEVEAEILGDFRASSPRSAALHAA